MAVVGSLFINLGANVKGAIDGLKKGEFAFNMAAKKFNSLEQKSEASINRMLALTSDVGLFAQNINNALTSIQDTGIDINSVPILAGLQAVSGQAQSLAVDVDQVTHTFSAMRATSTGALTSIAQIIPKSIGAPMLAAAGPIGLVTAGIVGVIAAIQKFDFVAQVVVDVINYFRELYNSSMTFRTGIETITASVRMLGRWFEFVWDITKNLWSTIGNAIKAIFSGDLDFGDVFSEGFKKAQQSSKQFADNLQKEYAKMKLNILLNPKLEPLTVDQLRSSLPFQNFASKSITDGVKSGIRRLKQTAVGLLPTLSIPTSLDFKATDLLDPKRFNVASIFAPELLVETQKKLQSISGEYRFIGSEMDMLRDKQRTLQQALSDAGAAGLSATNDTVIQLQASLALVNSQIATITSQLPTLSEVAVQAFSQMGDSLAQGAASFRDFGSQVIRELGKVIAQLIRTLILQSLLDVGLGGGVAKGLSGLVSGLFSTGFNSATSPPALATGGLAYGPTYAMVGDNRNASVDPEVIAPLSKLKSFFGPSTGGAVDVNVRGIAYGDDLLLTNDRSQARKDRYG